MSLKINRLDQIKKMDLSQIEINDFWNSGDEKEAKIHRIHAYPAKFPAFLTNKALEFARFNSLKPKLIADVFCGCGTVAYEAKRNNIDFWGCDINPVATLIARVKSRSYHPLKLSNYYKRIISEFDKTPTPKLLYDEANERLKYWYDEYQYIELSRLKLAIESTIPATSSYRLFFLCAFSNILKSTSRWLTKSIKPQIDPNKKPRNVVAAFEEQYRYMEMAYQEITENEKSKTEIITGNFLRASKNRPQVDMIITSPPYVTSYEYADLHQLSSLWLGFTNDFRNLRRGSVGSLHHSYNFDSEYKKLNSTGINIVTELIKKDKSQARSVAKYYIDMQRTVDECKKMLNTNGMAMFVIGDTEYKDVRIENSRHLCETLLSQGFSDIEITKRKISGKILTPYRDESGRFSTDSSAKKIYSEEFIVIGRKR